MSAMPQSAVGRPMLPLSPLAAQPLPVPSSQAQAGLGCTKILSAEMACISRLARRRTKCLNESEEHRRHKVGRCG